MATRLFCIKEENGVPVEARLAGRTMVNQFSIQAEISRLTGRGWTRVETLCADSKLLVQAARWVSGLLKVNPRYALEPPALMGYIRTPNWDDPGPDYAHYADTVRSYGQELYTEFSSYRNVPVDEAGRRYRFLMDSIGIKTEV